jgi:hypothetical protein
MIARFDAGPRFQHIDAAGFGGVSSTLAWVVLDLARSGPGRRSRLS